MVTRVVVGAHYGLRGWLVQRISAIVIAVYTIVVVAVLAAARPADYAGWKALFGHGLMRFATLLFVVSVLLHAWVGMRDILMDYVKPTGVRLALHVVVMCLLVGYAGWAVQILWRI
jgi:succinate dehydrogenase / fumarate reductase membrane anchor subunit